MRSSIIQRTGLTLLTVASLTIFANSARAGLLPGCQEKSKTQLEREEQECFETSLRLYKRQQPYLLEIVNAISNHNLKKVDFTHLKDQHGNPLSSYCDIYTADIDGLVDCPNGGRIQLDVPYHCGFKNGRATVLHSKDVCSFWDN